VESWDFTDIDLELRFGRSKFLKFRVRAAGTNYILLCLALVFTYLGPSSGSAKFKNF